jgi:hypothetical protein
MKNFTILAVGLFLAGIVSIGGAFAVRNELAIENSCVSYTAYTFGKKSWQKVIKIGDIQRIDLRVSSVHGVRRGGRRAALYVVCGTETVIWQTPLIGCKKIKEEFDEGLKRGSFFLSFRPLRGLLVVGAVSILLGILECRRASRYEKWFKQSFSRGTTDLG